MKPSYRFGSFGRNTGKPQIEDPMGLDNSCFRVGDNTVKWATALRTAAIFWRTTARAIHFVNHVARPLKKIERFGISG
jgi:hypothetical protein